MLKLQQQRCVTPTPTVNTIGLRTNGYDCRIEQIRLYNIYIE